MYILAIETTGPHASVALANENREIVEVISQGKMNHLQNLMPLVETILKANNVDKKELSYIAASEGPGSFTGIRIGVSSARALAQALEIPCIAVPTLKSFAYNAEGYDAVIAPIFDARRSQVYAGAYHWCDGKIEEVLEGNAYDLIEFLDKLDSSMKGGKFGKKVTFFGDGVPVYKEKAAEWNKGKYTFEFCENYLALQRASSVASLALDLLNEGKTINYDEFLPNYMRKSEAERKLEDGTLGKKKSK